MRKSVIFLFLFIFSTTQIYSDKTINEMNKKIKNIDAEINKKNTRIKNINTETSKLEKSIKELEAEIKKIELERKEIELEIEIVKKNIDYGEKNLEISIREHDKKELEYIAKIIAWDKYAKVHSKELEAKLLLKKNYREVLHGDLQRMEHIEKVTGSIKEVKEKIEIDKKKLDNLRNELAANLKKSDLKKEEHKKLIQKLNIEKKDHQTSISKLQKEKQRISKEIERIIKENIRKQEEARKKKEKSSGKSTTSPTKPKSSITNVEAYKKIGKTKKPVEGKIVVYFNEKKAGVVESNGIEIKAKVGANVVAAKAGEVIYADKFQGLGRVIMIDYGNNIIAVYGNLIATKVSVNSKVTAGQSIGALGLSSDKEPNLYYELRVNLKPIDPLPTF
ncbi:MAG: peptidoglycan DD-metalloendopeptidase family protein [Fusobacterium sp.]|uniref:murein hydrolase activator EnvC family protein n=1 Tax=Fusobacterium sp. TaxID=68766 RepID=UPI0026DBA09F|nr:peptidoglycan DD-metalloendopeptidase family protein [Fusobacterium sp.]MDO4691122.1 peptidoglycan DD-metalloendopeptidase family protein [Fusobacterium sp.]